MKKLFVCQACGGPTSAPIADTGADNYGKCPKCKAWQPIRVEWDYGDDDD